MEQPVADRYKLASYWWVASEIIRRNPKLELRETYPMDGFYDCLTIHGGSARGRVQIDLNRVGNIDVHPDHIHLAEATDLLAQSDPHEMVKTIETAAGLSPGSIAPPTNPRILVYRILARTLNYLVNDSSTWDVRPLTPRESGHALSVLDDDTIPQGNSPLPEIFATPHEFRSFVVGSHFGAPAPDGRFWALKRGQLVVAVFDTNGTVYTAEGRSALRPLYARVGRNLTRFGRHLAQTGAADRWKGHREGAT